MLTLNSIKLCTARLTRPGLGVGLRGVNGPFELNLTSTYKIKQSSFKQAPVFFFFFFTYNTHTAVTPVRIRWHLTYSVPAPLLITVTSLCLMKTSIN